MAQSTDANPYADFNSSGSVTMRYLDGQAVDQILAQTNSSGTTEWYITDKLGSVEDYVGTGGGVLDHVTYDSFGNITSQTNSTYANRFMFAGMEYDSTTGLYDDHARYYDSVTGRFVSQDPMGFDAGDTDPYRYVGNGPTSAIDPSGEIWWFLLIVAAAALAGCGPPPPDPVFQSLPPPPDNPFPGANEPNIDPGTDPDTDPETQKPVANPAPGTPVPGEPGFDKKPPQHIPPPEHPQRRPDPFDRPPPTMLT